MLIATDLDGTLLPVDAAGLSDRSAAVLARADQAGIPVVFVTGRPLRWMTHLWTHVGRHGRAIVSNGAVVYDVPSQAVIRLAGIDPDDGLSIVANVRATIPEATFAVECLDGIRVEPDYHSPHDLIDRAPCGPLEHVWDAPAVKLLIRHDGHGAIDPAAFCRQVSDAVGDTAVCTWSRPGLLEVSAPGVTKATALQWLAGELGIERQDVIAFGDMPNDVAMLTWAGVSYAVEGAHPEAVAAADQHAPSCADDGVAAVIETLLDRSGSTRLGQ